MRSWRLGRGLNGVGPLLLALVALGLATARPAGAQLNLTPVVNVSNNSGFSRQPHMVVDDAGTLHLAWADDTGNDGIYRILYARSFDKGATFTAPLPISTGEGSGLRPRLAVHGVNVYVVWMEDPPGAPTNFTKEIMFSRSVSGGGSFSAPINLSNTPLANSQEGRVAVAPNGTVFVVWDEGAPSRHVALRRSIDGGDTWGTDQAPFPVVGSFGTSGPTGLQTPYPGIAVDQNNGSVHLVWHDMVSGNYQVLTSHSGDDGVTFSSPLNISHAALHAHCASITVGPSGKVLIAWENRKQQNPHQHDAYFAQSTDGGASFSPPVNLSNGPSWALSDYPWAVEGPSGIIVVGWEDNTAGGDAQAVVAVSTDGGITFAPLANVANTTTTSTEVVTLFAPDGTFYIAWEEDASASGPAEILLRTAATPGGGGGGGSPSFEDVPNGYWAKPWIDALARSGVTGGCATNPARFCPEGSVTRAEMAVFLLKAELGPSFSPPAPGGAFGDVTPSYWAAAWIEELVREGITAGCGAGNYCPDAPVTRAQMAVFLLKTHLGAGFAPPPPSGLFADVPPSYWAAAWIEELVRQGITAGCGGGNYCPDAAVTRAEMAVFLVKTFNIPLQ
jgi:hypothetical protein